MLYLIYIKDFFCHSEDTVLKTNFNILLFSVTVVIIKAMKTLENHLIYLIYIVYT